MKKLLLLKILFVINIVAFAQGVTPPPPCGYSPLKQCDEDSDGFATFNLVEWDRFPYPCGNFDINPNDYHPLTFYVTQEDADNNQNAIVDPINYINLENPQFIYIRADKINPTGSSNDVLTNQDYIEAFPPPAATTPSDFILCDLYGTGIREFNLNTKKEEILGDQTDYAVSFFENINDAMSLTNPIDNSYINTVLYQQTVYASVFIFGDTDCVEVVEFDLLVQGECINEARDLYSCYFGISLQGEYDLTQNNSSLIGNQDNRIVTYHTSFSNAKNNVAIQNPTSYIHVDGPESTIYARVTNEITSDYIITSFKLITWYEPGINEVYNLEVCDNDLDGYASFNLEELTPIIPDPYLVSDVTYYESQLDAELGENALNSPYQNITPNSQTIYVRVASFYTTTNEAQFSGCFVYTNFDIIALDCSDSDNDGVIDSAEDRNGNGNLQDDDTDEDNIPDYLDDDDDGDKVSTLIEISIQTGRMQHDFVDTDEDLVENYLDDDDDGDGVLTKDEDYNGNGDPTDDDTNNNSIPDYLEASVALSSSEFSEASFKLYPNPATDIVTIEHHSFNENTTIEIFDMLGKLVLTLKNEESINVSSLKSGVYFLQIKLDNQQQTKKLIIK